MKKTQTIFVLWDEEDGLLADRFYLDEESATIGLQENYHEDWIYSGKAKVIRKQAVTYFASENNKVGLKEIDGTYISNGPKPEVRLPKNSSEIEHESESVHIPLSDVPGLPRKRVSTVCKPIRKTEK